MLTNLPKKNKRKNWRLLIFFSQQVLCLVAITVLSFFITISWDVIIAFCICIISGVILILMDKEKILVDRGTYYLFAYCYWCLTILSMVTYTCQMNSNSETYLGVDDDDTKYMTNVISWGVIFITTFITFVLTYYKTNKEQVYVTHTELDIQTKVHNMSLLISQQVLSLTAIIVLSILVTVNWIIIVVFSICLISGVILILVDRGKISVGDKTYYWFEYCYICLCFLSLAVLIWQTINDITARWGEATTYADSEKLTISIIISGLFVIIDITILIYIMIRLKPKESRGFILDPSQTSEESS